MLLRIARFGLGMLIGVLASVLLAGYWVFCSANPAEKPAGYEGLPGGGRLALSPLVEFNRMLRLRIVLGRRNNILQRGGRPICALDQVVSVELDDAPRIYVMNTLALVLIDDRRLMLLYYDTPTDRRLLRKAETIAAFSGVPLKATMA